VPFRDNKLTRILQGSLSGKSIIVLLATISENPDFLNETIGTLNFAMRCKGLTIKPMIQSFSVENPEEIKRNNENQQENIEKSLENDEIFEGNHENNEKSEVLATFLIKLLKGMRKLIRKEGRNLRENSMKNVDFQEKIEASSGKLKYNFSLQQATLSGFFLKELQKIDEKIPFFLDFPEKSDLFPKDFSEDFLKKNDFEEILNKVQKLADFLVKNIRNFCHEIETLKQEIVVFSILQRKRQEEIENWGNCLAFSLQTLLEKHQECLRKDFPNIGLFDLEQKSLDFHKEILKKCEDLFNRNEFYQDLDFFREKLNIIKTKDFSHKIRDFSFMESLRTLQKYSSNRENMSNSNRSPNIEDENLKNPIIEIFNKEEAKKTLYSKEKTLEKQKNFDIPLINLMIPPKEISINLNDLTDFKKNKKKAFPEELLLAETPKKLLESPMKIPESPMKSSESPMKSSESPMKSSENQKIIEKNMIRTDTPTKKNLLIKYLETEIHNEMNSEEKNENSGDFKRAAENVLEKPEIMEFSLKRLSSEYKGKPLPNELVRSVLDKNAVRTRNNTIMLKDRTSTLCAKSPRSKFDNNNVMDYVKKKSEITDEVSLLKFIDNSLDNI